MELACGDGYTRWDSEHCHSESLVQTRVVQDAATARDVAHGPRTQEAMPPHPRTGRGSIAGPGADQGSVEPIRQPAGLGLRYPRRCQAEDQAKAAWRTQAAAIGGGSADSFRCWRIFRMTSPCVIAAMIRSPPADTRGSAPYPAQRRSSAAAPNSSAAIPCRSPPHPPSPAGGAWG